MKCDSINDLPQSGLWVLMPNVFSDDDGNEIPPGRVRLKAHPDIYMKFTTDDAEEELIRLVDWAPRYGSVTVKAGVDLARVTKWADVQEEEFPVWVQERVSVLKTVASTRTASRGCLIVPGVGAYFYSSGVMWMNYPKEKADG